MFTCLFCLFTCFVYLFCFFIAVFVHSMFVCFLVHLFDGWLHGALVGLLLTCLLIGQPGRQLASQMFAGRLVSYTLCSLAQQLLSGLAVH